MLTPWVLEMDMLWMGCVAVAAMLLALYNTADSRGHGTWHPVQAARGLAEVTVEEPPAAEALGDTAADRFQAIYHGYRARHAAAIALLDGAEGLSPEQRAAALAELRFVVAVVDSAGLGNRLPGAKHGPALSDVNLRPLFELAATSCRVCSRSASLLPLLMTHRVQWRAVHVLSRS